MFELLSISRASREIGLWRVAPTLRVINYRPLSCNLIRVCNIINCGAEIKLGIRCFSTRNGLDFRRILPMILEMLEKRAGFYPVQDLIPVAREVLQAWHALISGVSTLLKRVPVLTCKFCPEVYIGDKGHLISTCIGSKRLHKNMYHQWVDGSLNDVIVPVETFHLDHMFQGVIKHHQRFEFDRIPAIVELCWQAGAHPHEKDVILSNLSILIERAASVDAKLLSDDDLTTVAAATLSSWETLEAGLKKLLLAYPAKVCKYCSEIHVGPSGHKARLCGMFKYESWRGTHYWGKASIGDLVPPKIVWRRKPQDPIVLVNEGRGFYGHTPAVVELCSQAGANPPSKYLCMMKYQGLPAPA